MYLVEHKSKCNMEEVLAVIGREGQDFKLEDCFSEYERSIPALGWILGTRLLVESLYPTEM